MTVGAPPSPPSSPPSCGLGSAYGGCATRAGGEFFFDLGDPDDDDFERKFKDPNGIIFDISQGGWGGAQKNPGEADNPAPHDTRKNLPKFDERRAQATAAVEKQRAKAMETA